MKNRISDEKIKDFVSRYVKGDDRCYSAIVNMLSQYIYNYPRVVFGTDPDTCSDFYEYVLSRFKSILTGLASRGGAAGQRRESPCGLRDRPE